MTSHHLVTTDIGSTFKDLTVDYDDGMVGTEVKIYGFWVTLRFSGYLPPSLELLADQGRAPFTLVEGGPVYELRDLRSTEYYSWIRFYHSYTWEGPHTKPMGLADLVKMAGHVERGDHDRYGA